MLKLPVLIAGIVFMVAAIHTMNPLFGVVAVLLIFAGIFVFPSDF